MHINFKKMFHLSKLLVSLHFNNNNKKLIL